MGCTFLEHTQLHFSGAHRRRGSDTVGIPSLPKTRQLAQAHFRGAATFSQSSGRRHVFGGSGKGRTITGPFCGSTGALRPLPIRKHIELFPGCSLPVTVTFRARARPGPGMRALHKVPGRRGILGRGLRGGGPGRPPFWRTLISPAERWGWTPVSLKNKHSTHTPAGVDTRTRSPYTSEVNGQEEESLFRG